MSQEDCERTVNNKRSSKTFVFARQWLKETRQNGVFFGCHAKEMIEPQAMASQAKLMASGSKAMMTLSFVALICPCEA